MNPNNLDSNDLKELREKALAKGPKKVTELLVSLRKSSYFDRDLKYAGFTDVEFAEGGFRNYWEIGRYFWMGIPKLAYFIDRREIREWWFRDDRIPSLGDRSIENCDRDIARYLGFGISLREIFLAYNLHGVFGPHFYADANKIRYFIDRWKLPVHFLKTILDGGNFRNTMLSDFDRSYFTKELLKALTVSQCTQVGISRVQIYGEKKDLSELRKCGTQAETFKELIGNKRLTLEDLLSSGYSFTELLTAGYDWQEVRSLGAKAKDFKDAAVPIFKLQPIYSEDRLFSWIELVESYGLGNMRKIYSSNNHPFPFAELMSAGLNLVQFKNAGFTPWELNRYYRVPIADLLAAGFTHKELREAFKGEGEWFLVREGLKEVKGLERTIKSLSH